MLLARNLQVGGCGLEDETSLTKLALSSQIQHKILRGGFVEFLLSVCTSL